jgi:predicted tellurium resistance membrane protein TerC
MIDFLLTILQWIAEFIYILFYVVYFIAVLLFMIGTVILLAQNLYYFFRGKSSACLPGPSWFEEYRRRNGL